MITEERQQQNRNVATVSWRSSTLSVEGASLHHVNRGVDVEHNETSFDYRSLRYIVNKRETNLSIMKVGIKAPSTFLQV
jgi:hypothetical protein